MELTKVKNIFFTGIKGVAMTALALAAQDMGIAVTGSDTSELFVTDAILKHRNIAWITGFDPKNITTKYDLVITTGSHGGLNNPEVLKAKELGIPVLTQAEALGEFITGKEVIAVCGVGGKTTTSALLAHIFDYCGLNPSYMVGVGMITPLGYPGRYVRKSKVFICEADEFVNSPGVDNTPKFLFLSPKVVIVTNIKYDHPDVYPTFAASQKAYLAFFRKIPPDGLLVINAKDKIADKLSLTLRCKVVKVKVGNKIPTFLPGEYNQRNIAAALEVADYYHLPKDKVLQAVKLFKGTQRRFEEIGETSDGVIVYDDYAHHPDELKAVLAAAREKFPHRRIVALFQPHTYSRTKALFTQFSQAFTKADVVGLMDIYASARETPDPEVTSKKLWESMKKVHPAVFYTGGHVSTLKWLQENLKPGDVLFTLGAGDIFYLHQKLCTKKI